MSKITIQSTSNTLLDDLSTELKKAGISDELLLSELESTPQYGNDRGDPVTWMMIALTAVGAGGALTALLSREGFLVALANVLGKYVEGRQAEVLIEDKNGRKIQVCGPVSEITAILQEIRDSE